MTDNYEEEKEDPRIGISGWKEPESQLQDATNEEKRVTISNFNNKDLEIHYAKYGPKKYKGNSNTYKDVVIHSINKQISPNDRLNLFVSNYNLGGDFHPGQEKQLHIIYTFNGVLCEEKLDEGELLVIPKLSTQISLNKFKAIRYYFQFI